MNRIVGVGRGLLLGGGMLVAATLGAGPAAAQEGCPGAAHPSAAEGWSAYREGSLEQARAAFEDALNRCPNHNGARTGLGYVSLREGEDGIARGLLQAVLREDPENVDARVGLGLLAWRAGELDQVERHFEAVLRLVPEHTTAERYLARVEEARAAEAAGDEADRAWEEGEHERAERLYSARVAADSTDTPALQRLALLRAWSGRYEEALELIDLLLELEPSNVDARVDRARILAWSGRVEEAIARLDAILEAEPGQLRALEAKARFLAWAGEEEASREAYLGVASAAPDTRAGSRIEARALVEARAFREAVEAYESLVARDSASAEARLGLGRVLTFAGRYDSARVVFRGVLEGAPGNLEALRGLGQALAWSGRLVDAEEAWRRALEIDARDPDALVGLAQTLRWQGRNAAALEVLQEAREVAPGNPEVETQMRWVLAQLSPRTRPRFAWEGDSDENAMLTTSVMAAFNLRPRLALRLDAYRREADQDPLGLDQTAQGFVFSGSYQVEPGWTFALGAGATESDSEREDVLSALRASVSTPGRHSVSGTLTLAREPLDATAFQIRRGVSVDRLTGEVAWSPASRWSVAGRATLADYEADEGNRHWEVAGGVSRTVGGAWRVGLGGRTFGFEKDLVDGYFDPDFYGLGEATLEWSRSWNRWRLAVEAASGIQQIGSGGDLSGAFRGGGRLTYRFAPGREVELSGAFAGNGLRSSATGETDYRYGTVGLNASWVIY